MVRPAERFASSHMVANMSQEMAQVLTAFCRARGVEYTEASGYAEQLAPFAALALSPGDMYNCFYALMSKFALKSVETDRYCTRLLVGELPMSQSQDALAVWLMMQLLTPPGILTQPGIRCIPAAADVPRR